MSEVSARGALSVSFGEACDRGKVREENQDSIRSASIPLGELFIVADGIGGYQGGATASRMVVEGFHAQLASRPAGYPPMDALMESCTATNAAIYERANTGDPAYQRMGSTVVLALLQPNGNSGPEAWIGHVGDSRAYLIRNGQMRKITSDHSAVQALLSRNLITEEEARNHPDASVLTRSLGHRPEVEIEIDRVPLQAGDALLLCSDGLWGYVADADIAAVATDANLSVQTLTDTLLHQALAAGGQDNIGIEYIRVEGGPAPIMPAVTGRLPGRTTLPLTSPAPDEAEIKNHKLRRLALILLLVAGCGALGTLGYVGYKRWSSHHHRNTPANNAGSQPAENPAPKPPPGSKNPPKQEKKSAKQANPGADANHSVQPPPPQQPAQRSGGKNVAVVGEIHESEHFPAAPEQINKFDVSVRRENRPECVRLAPEKGAVYLTPEINRNHVEKGVWQAVVRHFPGIEGRVDGSHLSYREMTDTVRTACGQEYDVVVFLPKKPGSTSASTPAPNGAPSSSTPDASDQQEYAPAPAGSLPPKHPPQPRL